MKYKIDKTLEASYNGKAIELYRNTNPTKSNIIKRFNQFDEMIEVLRKFSVNQFKLDELENASNKINKYKSEKTDLMGDIVNKYYYSFGYLDEQGNYDNIGKFVVINLCNDETQHILLPTFYLSLPLQSSSSGLITSSTDLKIDFMMLDEETDSHSATEESFDLIYDYYKTLLCGTDNECYMENL